MTPPLVNADSLFSTSPSFHSSHHRSGSLSELVQSFSNLPIDDSYQSPAPSLEASELADYFPQCPMLLQSTPDLRLQTASCDLRRRLSRGLPELEAALEQATREAAQKTQEVRALTKRVTALEELLRRDRASLTALREENARLQERLKRTEKGLAEKLGEKVQRLSGILSKSNERLQAFQLSRAQSPVGQDDVYKRLLRENKRLVAERNDEKQWFKRELNSCLRGLAVQLATLGHGLEQLSQVFSCIRKGEQVPVTLLLQHTVAAVPAEDLALTCKLEMDRIQTAVAAIRKVASDFYAEQCGQICNTQ